MKTKKQLLTELTADGAIVTATIVGPMTTLTEWPEFEARLTVAGWVKRPGGNTTVFDEPGNTGRYFTKPRMHRVRHGVITCQRTAYTFTWPDDFHGELQSTGQIVDLKVNDDVLELTMFNNNKVQYALSTKE